MLREHRRGNKQKWVIQIISPVVLVAGGIQSHCWRWNIFCYTVVVKSSIHPHLKMGCILLYRGSQIIHPSTLLKMGCILLNHGSQTILLYKGLKSPWWNLVKVNLSSVWMDGWFDFHGLIKYIPSSTVWMDGWFDYHVRNVISSTSYQNNWRYYLYYPFLFIAPSVFS
jgi:hypothetical protein